MTVERNKGDFGVMEDATKPPPGLPPEFVEDWTCVINTLQKTQEGSDNWFMLCRWQAALEALAAYRNDMQRLQKIADDRSCDLARRDKLLQEVLEWADNHLAFKEVQEGGWSELGRRITAELEGT